jgi:hypothetical protein
VDRKHLGSFKCCAGEEWRRSGGRIVWETKFNVELRTDVAYVQQKEGTLTRMAISCVRTAF